MSLPKHSATPWQLCHHLDSLEKDADCKCGYRGGIWGDAGELLVCEMRNCDLHEGHDMIPVGDRPTQLANAHFIVKACNSHEALVAALQDMVDHFKPFRMKPIGSPGSPARLDQEMQISVYDAARAVLKASSVSPPGRSTPEASS